LRFVNRLKSQLLISHLFLPIKQMRSSKKERENQATFGKYPRLFELFDQFLFQCGTLSARLRRLLVQHHMANGRALEPAAGAL
jgi:hypothetical protein